MDKADSQSLIEMFSGGRSLTTLSDALIVNILFFLASSTNVAVSYTHLTLPTTEAV